MSERRHRVILQTDVFAVTVKGENELTGSATSLTPSALEVLVLTDGRSTVGETAARARITDMATVVAILGNLLNDGLIDFVTDKAISLDFIDFFQTEGPVAPSVAATAKANRETAATLALLQQRGYAVRIARRAGTGKAAEKPRLLSVLVVEDEPHLAKLLQHILEGEGFRVRTAKNREEIVAEIRRGPRPDLVLLDVLLPDADGFEILLKIRQHPGLQDMPVVMLTSMATRDAVLNGLARGANGYITKPFRIDVLVKAVNVVLGLSDGGPADQTNEDPWLA